MLCFRNPPAPGWNVNWGPGVGHVPAAPPAAVRHQPHLRIQLAGGVLQSPLATRTPFSAILVAEVYLLIHYPANVVCTVHGQADGNFALIEIRSVFRTWTSRPSGRGIPISSRICWEQWSLFHPGGLLHVAAANCAHRGNGLSVSLNSKNPRGLPIRLPHLPDGWLSSPGPTSTPVSDWALHDPNDFFYNDFLRLILVDVFSW